MSSMSNPNQFVYDLIKGLTEHICNGPAPIPPILESKATMLLDQLSTGILDVRVVPAEPATDAMPPAAPADDVTDALRPLGNIAAELFSLVGTYSRLPDEVMSELEYALTATLKAQRLCVAATRGRS